MGWFVERENKLERFPGNCIRTAAVLLDILIERLTTMKYSAYLKLNQELPLSLFMYV